MASQNTTIYLYLSSVLHSIKTGASGHQAKDFEFQINRSCSGKILANLNLLKRIYYGAE
jgi:hypothetical protein